MELKHIGLEERKDLLPTLLAVWESSVRATHEFLREGDVEFLNPYVEQGLGEIPLLFCALEDGRPIAFLGISGMSLDGKSGNAGSVIHKERTPGHQALIAVISTLV